MTNTNKELEEMVEQMADIEHKRWSSWQKWMHECSTKNADGSLTIPADKVERWERQITTEYKDLSEEEKESDRKQVYPYLDIITSYREQGVKELAERYITLMNVALGDTKLPEDVWKKIATANQLILDK